ncbi:MAG: choice-of-anchor D domain-containing protein [Planctomycetes bacterium]|nr:choice-of-anchor D domain-containing protein [Planctomycetota bacterium]
MRSHTQRLGRAGALVAGVLSLYLVAGTAAAQTESYFDPEAKALQRASVDAITRDYLVDVGPRLIAPSRDTDVDMSRGSADVYVQFERALSAHERKAYQLEGVVFERAMRGHTYRALVPRQAMRRLTLDPLFRGIEPVLTVDRLSFGLWADEVDARHADGSVDAFARFHPSVSLERAHALLDRWGVRYDHDADFLFGKRVAVNVTHGQALVLAEDPSIVRVFELPPPPKEDNVVAAALSNIDDVQAAPYNLDGAGEIVGIWDGGDVRPDHEQLTGRVFLHDGAGNNDHSTHVAGTMIGDGTGNPAALGMAPGVAELHSYDFNGDPTTEMLGAWFSFAIQYANHSWGSVLGWDQGSDTGNAGEFGNYNSTAEDWDDLVQVTQLLVQKSAGNDGNDCDAGGTNCDGVAGADGYRYDTIGTQGNAKNIITVGAVNGTPVLTGFSSCGPTDDKRIKPDIVAKGDSLISAWAQGVTLNSCGLGTDYCAIGGTSMSTPTTTGGIVLITDQYRDIYSQANPRPDVIKALVVNTARDQGRFGPDYAYGHGLLDVQAAVDVVQVGPSRILTDELETGFTKSYLMLVRDGQPQLRVTAAWTDEPGVADSSDPDLVNNLDFKLIAPNGAVFWPFSGPTGLPTDPATATAANTVDNVEAFIVNNPQTGVWTIQGKGQSVPFGPQAFALVCNSPLWLDTIPDIEVVNEITFDHACTNQGDVPQEKTLSIFNLGGGNLHINDVQLTAGSPQFELLDRPSPPFVLVPGAHIELIVKFTPTLAGIHTGTIEISSNDPDEGLRTVELSGLAAVPLMTVTLEGKGEFGDIQLGHRENRELQVVNHGLCNLVLIDLQQLSGSSEFSVGGIPGHPGFPITLFPGEHIMIPFEYAPTDFGPDFAQMQLSTNDTKKPVLIFPLHGECSPPILTTSGDFHFGEVCPDEQPERTMQICNTGWSDLEVTDASIEFGCTDFEIVGNPFPATVSHDFCMPLTVRYTPTGVGTHVCTLTIQTNDPLRPQLIVNLVGTTKPVSVDVPAEVGFPPTVIQSVSDCRSYMPYPITNNGDCPVTITEVNLVQTGTDYSFVNLPGLPVTLLPGETLGDGQLQICFAPTFVFRHIAAEAEVKWISNDPLMGDEDTFTTKLCGEGVRTGLRILVKENGVPVAQVHKIDLFYVVNPGTAQESLGTVTAQRFVNLVDVPEHAPCPAFQFHREWGGETDPTGLTPGTYRVWVRIQGSDGLEHSIAVDFVLGLCDFEGDYVIDFNI